ncbi:MAG TPA: hypothetical protein VMS73_08895 [Anaerolineaceae bacterium]|nr:hypothetical protein [Anaerolineaceae bacterium]
MAGKLRYLVLLIGLAVLSIGVTAGQNYAPTANSVYLVSPATCPAGGCVAGQRLDMRSDFSLGTYDAVTGPNNFNVQVCIFTPNNWSVGTPEPLTTGTLGGVSGAQYTPSVRDCGILPPNDYALAGGAESALPAGIFGDSLPFGFRLNSTASNPGSILVRVRELISGIWTTTSEAFNFLPVTATTTTVFVGNDATACGTNIPCYVNSGDDLAGGVGTGLKDAIDSSTPAITINVLGNYNIKKNTILIDNPHLIVGLNNASLIYPGADCSLPMLNINSGATLRSLAINDGTCSTTNRILVWVEDTSSTDLVTIESNDLTLGQEGIHVGPSNAANIEVRYNQIQNNVGLGINLDKVNTGITTGVLEAVANNILQNNYDTATQKYKAQIDCKAKTEGAADHNFWGGLTTTVAISNCTFTDAKRLGAAILHNTNTPGVSSQRVTVSSTLAYAFNNEIGFQLLRTTTINNFDLYIVNHGAGSAANVPFTGAQTNNPTACSNYWDVFMADNTTPDSTSVLDLHFKYDLTADCVATIKTTRFCLQSSDQSQYPLFWYEVGANTWAATGRSPGGQQTRCDISKSEVVVSIDSTDGRPSFNDLSHVPFVAGLPGQPAAVTFASFTADPGDKKVVLNWTTSSEVGTSGFVVMRSIVADSGFTDVSDLIPSTATNQGGATYQYIDQLNLVNYTKYYYRLRIVNTDLTTVLSGTVSVTPFPSTPTPTSTPTITRTPAPTNTYTPTRTLYPTTIFYYVSPTRTKTVTMTPTSPFMSITPTLELAATASPSSIPFKYVTGYPAATNTPGAATQLIEARETRTAVAQESITPTPKPGAEPIHISLTGALGLLALLAALGAVVIFILRNHLHLPA